MKVFIRQILSLAIWIGACGLAAAAEPAQDLSNLKSRAESGEPQAMLDYGKALYNSSRSEQQRTSSAEPWIRRAADAGNPEAIFWLGYAGLGSEDAVVYYKQVAELGYPDAFEPAFNGLLFDGGKHYDLNEAKRLADLARKLKITTRFSDLPWLLDIVDDCYDAGTQEIPESDRPTADEVKRFSKWQGDCFDFRYGLGVPQDWTNYRKCLLARDADKVSSAEIYANGWGVSRNAKLAISLLCRNDGVPAEQWASVAYVHRTRNDAKLESEFDYCDFATSGLTEGYCAQERKRVADKKRNLGFQSLMAGWKPAQKTAFSNLLDASDQFILEHSESEFDQRGTLSAALQESLKQELQEELRFDVFAFEAGHMPGRADFAKADKDLNVLYANIMKQPRLEDGGTVTLEGIRKTQRKWIKYRDAWMAFMTSRYLLARDEEWAGWLTRRRIEQLRGFSSVD